MSLGNRIGASSGSSSFGAAALGGASERGCSARFIYIT